ncbi:MAG TPA: hypothetical protein VLM40_13920 [Gemmata sp.]|nr:hypothetical protein [Gemmata sp.]
MPLITCPGCDEELEIEPEECGTRIKCPECGEKFTVPEKGRGTDDSRPRKKKRGKAAAGANWGLIAGLAIGAVALVVGGLVAYKATRPKKELPVANSSSPENPPPRLPFGPAPAGPSDPINSNSPKEPDLPPPPPLPQGWVQFAAEDVKLTAHLPGKPKGIDDSESEMGGYRVKNRMYAYEVPMEGGGYDLDVMILPAGANPNAEQQGEFLRLPEHQIVRLGKGQVTAKRSATLAGAPAAELEFAVEGITGIYRYGFVRAGDRLLFVMAKAAGPKISPEDRLAFLNSIRPAGR